MKKVLAAKKQWSDLNLSDSFLFGEVMQDEETCRTVLEIILKRPIGHLVYVNKEQVMESGTAYHEYKGIRLDVYFKDEENVCYSVEMQNSSQYNLPKRSRHYQSMIDAKGMESGTIDYTNLCDSIIILSYRKARHLRSEVWLCQTSKCRFFTALFALLICFKKNFSVIRLKTHAGKSPI